MAKEIPQELKEFKEKVSPGIGKMRSVIESITSKIEELDAAVKATSTNVSSAYQSSTDVNQAIAKLQNTSEIITNMKNDIKSVFDKAISMAETIIESVTKLETLLEKIEECESTIATENAKKEGANLSLLSKAREELKKAEQDFDKIKEEAIATLNDLRGMDKEVTVEKEAAGGSTLATYTQYLQNLKYGTFELHRFTASNGVSMRYYLYIPDYGTGSVVEGLPVFMYLHGGGQQTGVGFHSCQGSGLTKALLNKEVTPSGIVVCPHIENFDKEYTFQALKELSDYVVETYKADKDHVSVGGHSWGAITAYNLVNRNPGYYSACVPISGMNEVTNGFKDVKVWAFHGTEDRRATSRTDYGRACKAIDEINFVGGDATMTALKGKGHSIAVEVVEGTYTSPDGKEENPIEWAFSQSRKKNTQTA